MMSDTDSNEKRKRRDSITAKQKELLTVVSDESSSESSSEIRNSATEISTDSEFAHDDPTPTREIPSIVFNDFNVTKTRGAGGQNARRIQVTSGFLQRPAAGGKNASPQVVVVGGGTAQRHTKPKSQLRNKDVELKLSPLVPSASPSVVARKPALPLLRSEGYALNRTQSTGGIAAKVSLELKKKYLLGETNGPNSIQKSGSASTLDTKFKSFHTNISDCQKLLKTTPEPSPGAFKGISPLKEVEKRKEDEQEQEPDLTPVIFENEPEGRPRSPVHETSIIVPNIDWSKNKSKSQSEDSLSEDSGHGVEKIIIPTVLIDEFPPDSLMSVETNKTEDARSVTSTASTTEPLKSICSEKKTLNQPKLLPELHEVLPDVHETLHTSGRSTPSNDSIAELATATVLTETELSDWARDGAVSDDLEDFEFCGNARNTKQPKVIESKPDHVCGKTIITEAMNSVLSKNLENIEFMDTGTETSSDDGGGLADSQNGYVLFKDEDEPVDSLNPIIEAINPKNEQLVKNTGYCVIQQDNFIDNVKEDSNFTDSTNNFVVSADKFGSEVIDLKPSDIEKTKSKVAQSEHDEDSLLIIDNNTGTTTEENTCSDSTVKNVTEIANEKLIENNNFQRKRLEDKLAKLKAEQAAKQQIEFDEHCHRLQSKVEFGNAKDSIDIRKSRRKSKSDSPRPDLIIQEEKETRVTVENPIYKTPDVLYKKEIIEKERDLNQKLIQEMVMNKMKAENKSLERKKRSRPSPNATSPYDLHKSATSDIVSEINKANLNISGTTSNYATPDLVLSSLNNKSDIEVFSTPAASMRPLSVFASFQDKGLIGGKENSSMPDVRKSLFNDSTSFRKSPDDVFRTPVAPPRLKHEEAKRTAEKLKQDARVRARLLSNEELGLSPEDKIAKLKEKLSKREERPNSCMVSNDTLNRKKNGSQHRRQSAGNEEQLLRTKSIPEVAAAAASTSAKTSDERNICKSDPNLLDTNEKKLKPVKKSKDRERRKSITKMITNLFTKKSPTGQKGIFSRMSPKTKDLSKEVLAEEPVRRKSFSEITSSRVDNSSPPPVPPLPLNYTGNSIKGTDESSDGEHDWKRNDRSSCDTIDQSGILDSSLSSLSNRRASKGAQRVVRQAQLKRLRMAQEIQRKLEEVEVKIRELEERGVVVEKALRVDERSQDADLMREWFDLMRDRTELRRYEKELTVRAEELELEDRHARLQHELRKRLDNNEQKTEKDIQVEGSIIKEMMDIVAKRDSLIAVLEEDRLRYSNEDRDFEEQMLSKGLMLTSVRKTPEK